jgi:hypothetical protein
MKLSISYDFFSFSFTKGYGVSDSNGNLPTASLKFVMELSLTKKKKNIIMQIKIKTGFTFLKPMSGAYCLKHLRQMLRPYLRMRPWVLLHTRLKAKHSHVNQSFK